MALLPGMEVDFYSTVGHEFYMTLSQSGAGLSAAKLDVLKLVDEEVNDGFKSLESPA